MQITEPKFKVGDTAYLVYQGALISTTVKSAVYDLEDQRWYYTQPQASSGGWTDEHLHLTLASAAEAHACELVRKFKQSDKFKQGPKGGV